MFSLSQIFSISFGEPSVTLGYAGNKRRKRRHFWQARDLLCNAECCTFPQCWFLSQALICRRSSSGFAAIHVRIDSVPGPLKMRFSDIRAYFSSGNYRHTEKNNVIFKHYVIRKKEEMYIAMLYLQIYWKINTTRLWCKSESYTETETDLPTFVSSWI